MMQSQPPVSPTSGSADFDQAGAKLRAVAAKVVFAVIQQGRSLTEALTQHENTVPARDQALLRELSYGVLRWYFPLRYMLAQLLSKSLKTRDRDLEALLLLGLYQLFYLRIPAYAAVSTSTEATRMLSKTWASGLVNGVLRQAQRQQAALLAALDKAPAAASAHPPWLLQALQTAWSQDWPSIISANNQRPPQSLRVNRRQLSRANYLRRLQDHGIKAEAAEHTDSGLTLAEPSDVAELPGFAQGWCSVQDPAAQLAAPLLQTQAGQRVLDACAAPGGKTGHLLELTNDLELWALDKSASRLAQLRENLTRLQVSARLMVADAADTAKWWDGRLFDRILLDAPCSGSGVIRRHPDIKVLRRADDIPRLAAQQLTLLTALWPLLKRGGMMLYAGCSVLPTETRQLIELFCQEHTDAHAVPIQAAWGRLAGPGRQILPGTMDGFFYARLHKLS